MLERGLTETELDEYLERLEHPPDRELPATDTTMVSVEDVLETIRDIYKYPDEYSEHFLGDLERRLMKIGVKRNEV